MKSKRIPTGRVFRRPYHDRKGQRQLTSTWHVTYYVNGKRVQVATQTEDYDEAVAVLREKMAGPATLNVYSDRPERVLMNQLFDLVVEVAACAATPPRITWH